MREQKPTIRCDCGRLATVTPTASWYEFDYQCACGERGTISWAHANPPPVWNGASYNRDLFTGTDYGT